MQKYQPLSQGLKSLGFDALPENEKPSIRIAIDGRVKDGKTHFALTAPGPIAFYTFDKGHKGVIEKFAREKAIGLKSFPIPVRPKGQEAMAKADAVKNWNDFVIHLKRTLQSKDIRTIIIDKGGDMWDLHRLAAFGKLTQVMPHHYVEVNQEHRELIKSFDGYDKNVILVYEVKKEFKMGKDGKEGWTGKYERSGFNAADGLVQVNLLAWCKEEEDEPTEFGVTIRNSRINQSDVRGMELAGDDCCFKTLAEMLYPDTAWEEWQ